MTSAVADPTGEASIGELLAAVQIDGGVEQARARQRTLSALFAEAGQMRLGRYQLGEPIAAGATGIVYDAYDPELDRVVAIKVLHGGTTGLSRTAKRSLLAEAQAMARLAHPNVVPIYDVGAIAPADQVPGLRDAVFIVMEKIDGGSLAQWLEADRTSDEILDAFITAARGLAAAHGAGLVHRDFKPSNVLVSGTGRILVTDFGLAVEFSPTHADSQSIVGTPAFMSPEQACGASVDARSDQFSLCVALDEALGNRVPAALRSVVARGLQHSPDDRYRSMHALLRALSRARSSRWRWGRAALLGAVGVAAAVVVAFGSPPSIDDTASDVGVVSAQEPSPLARRMLDDVEVLQDAGHHWEALILAGIAEAAATRSGPSSCQAEAMIRHAELQLAVGLPRAARDRLTAAFRVAASAHDDTLEAEAAVRLVSVMGYHLHQTDEAWRWARQAQSLLDAMPVDRHLSSTLQTHMGNVAYADGDLDGAIGYIRASLALREVHAGSDDPTVLALLNNLGVALTEAGETTEAKRVHQRALRLAEATVGRRHPDYGGSWHNLAMAHLEAGELEDAERALREALDVLGPNLGSEHPRVGHALTGLSRVYAAMGKHDDALAYGRRAVATWESIHDANHPQVALAQVAEAQALLGLGKIEAARTSAEQAVARLERTLGVEHQATRSAEALLQEIRISGEGVG